MGNRGSKKVKQDPTGFHKVLTDASSSREFEDTALESGFQGIYDSVSRNCAYTIRYASMSLRGGNFDEMGQKRASTDICFRECICEDVDDPIFYFSLLDGHGEHGFTIGNYTSKKLKLIIQRNIQTTKRINGGQLTDQGLDDVLITSYHEMNHKLIQKFGRQANQSGCSCISILMRGDKLYVANVGTCRGVIGSVLHGSKLSHEPLTIDQTTFRHDELKRIQGSGGIISNEINVSSGRESLSAANSSRNLLDDQPLWGSMFSSPRSSFGSEHDSVDSKQEKKQMFGVKQKSRSNRGSRSSKQRSKTPNSDFSEMSSGNNTPLPKKRRKSRVVSDLFAWEDEVPKVYLSQEDTDGVVFTRSLGDIQYKDIGIIATPETFIRTIKPDDHIILLGSDGLCEWVSNESIVERADRYADDPFQAAKDLTGEAYRLGYQNDIKSDDISCIVIFIENFTTIRRQGKKPSISGRTSAQKGYKSLQSYSSAIGANLDQKKAEASDGEYESSEVSVDSGFSGSGFFKSLFNRPPRTKISRERKDLFKTGMKKLQKISPQEGDEDNYFGFIHQPLGEIDSLEVDTLTTLTENNLLFSDLSETQKLLIFKSMERLYVSAGDVVIKQGDAGSHYYICESGSYTVYRREENRDKDIKIFEYTEPGSAFGEISLLFQRPRSATVIANTAGTLWRLGRPEFREVLLSKKIPKFELYRILRRMYIFQDLSAEQILRLTNHSEEIVYPSGVYVLEKGHKFHELYIILEGECEGYIYTKAAIQFDNSQITPISTRFYPKYSHFGEETLLWNRTGRIDVVVKSTQAKILIIRERWFLEIIATIRKNIIQPPNMIDLDQFEDSLKPDGVDYKLFEEFTSIDHFELIKLVESSNNQHWCIAKLKKKTSDRLYTLKIISKSSIKSPDQMVDILEERRFLNIYSPRSSFIPSLICSFQDEKHLYTVFSENILFTLEHCIGGHRNTEGVVRFYLSLLFTALQVIHEIGWIHHKLSLSNIRIMRNGYPIISDFSCLKLIKDDDYENEIDPLYYDDSSDNDSDRFSVIEDELDEEVYFSPYSPPEIYSEHEGSTFSPLYDYFSLGVIGYELITGSYPYTLIRKTEESYEKYRENLPEWKETQRLLRYEDSLCTREYPEGVSYSCRSFLDGLLTLDPLQRLGKNGLDDIKNHLWVSMVEWDVCEWGFLTAPHIKTVDKYMTKRNPPNKRSFKDIFDQTEDQDQINELYFQEF